MEIVEDLESWTLDYQQRWLADLEKNGQQNWKLYSYVKNKESVAGKAVDLSKSRLALISTAGAYLKDSHEPFDAANMLGDYTIRCFPSSTDFTELDYAHEHYDQTAVRADAQVLLPLRHLEELTQTGKVSELAPSVISYSGYQPDVSKIVHELVPAVIELAQQDRIEAALLVPS